MDPITFGILLVVLLILAFRGSKNDPVGEVIQVMVGQEEPNVSNGSGCMFIIILGVIVGILLVAGGASGGK